MKVTLAWEAEQELIYRARYYASHADVDLGLAFIDEFERAFDILRAQPTPGAPWLASTRRFLSIGPPRAKRRRCPDPTRAG